MAVTIPTPTNAQDLFTGMVVTDGEDLVLERCHIGSARYRLRFAEGADHPLAQLRGKTGLVQAQIFGHYRVEGDGHALDVIGVDGVQFGKSCHLVDAVEAYFSEIAEHVSAPKTGANNWKALDAGAAAPAGTETIGTGDYAYRFRLVDPYTGNAMGSRPYALTNSKYWPFRLALRAR